MFEILWQNYNQGLRDIITSEMLGEMLAFFTVLGFAFAVMGVIVISSFHIEKIIKQRSNR